MKRLISVRSVPAAVALFCVVAVSSPAAFGAEREFKAGDHYFGRSNYVEYIAGDLPVIIAAPHGGREKPENIPDRIIGTFAFDTNTQELARAIAAEFKERTGGTPHVVLCRISRRKVDCNRAVAEGAQKHPLATMAWEDYHAFLERARAEVVRQHGRGFFLDVHGHGHAEQQVEIGYLHSRALLSQPDSALDAPEVMAGGSLRGLKETLTIPYSQVLRGSNSLGALLMAEGFPATPSPERPSPTEPYFNGGYCTVRYGREAGAIVGVQFETYYRGLRDSPENRRKFAEAACSAIGVFLEEFQGVKLPSLSSQ